jgi:hypothetical protein
MRPAQANSSCDLTSKITRAKWPGGMDLTIECLICKHESPKFKLQSHQKKKKKEERRKEKKKRVPLICQRLIVA